LFDFSYLFSKKITYKVINKLKDAKRCSIFIRHITYASALPCESRQHLSYDVCLEVRGEIIRTVLFCIVCWSCA